MITLLDCWPTLDPPPEPDHRGQRPKPRIEASQPELIKRRQWRQLIKPDHAKRAVDHQARHLIADQAEQHLRRVDQLWREGRDQQQPIDRID